MKPIAAQLAALRLSWQSKDRRLQVDGLLGRLRKAAEDAEPRLAPTYQHLIGLLDNAFLTATDLLDAVEEHHLAAAECNEIPRKALVADFDRLEARLSALQAGRSRTVDPDVLNDQDDVLAAYDADLRAAEKLLADLRQAELVGAKEEQSGIDLILSFFDKVVAKTETTFRRDVAVNAFQAAIGALPLVGGAADLEGRLFGLLTRRNRGFEATRDHMRYILGLGDAVSDWTYRAKTWTDRLKRTTPGDDCI